MEIAEKGYVKASQDLYGLKEGINVCQGSVTSEPVARDCGYEYVPVDKFLK